MRGRVAVGAEDAEVVVIDGGGVDRALGGVGDGEEVDEGVGRGVAGVGEGGGRGEVADGVGAALDVGDEEVAGVGGFAVGVGEVAPIVPTARRSPLGRRARWSIHSAFRG